MAGEKISNAETRIITDNGDRIEKVGDYPVTQLLSRAKKIVHERTKDWEIINLKAEERFPTFHRDEIEVSGVLGIGGFFVVHGIKRIVLRENEDESETTGDESLEDLCCDDDRFKQSTVQNRKFMQTHCLRHGKDPRYALKTMQPASLHDPGTCLNSMVDLVIEFKFLSAVRHPNIIKMRAVSAGDIFHPQAFLILDKIYSTLTDRIKKWNEKEHSVFHKLFDYNRKREKHFLAKRLLVAYDIASALAYLHDINIMFRDLKPNNIGFDVRNDPKLFDFGLAIEFRRDEVQAGTYTLTGDTGTLRYMAPEVALFHPYNEKADVYSFGMLLWEICEMATSYPKLSDEEVKRKVLYMGYRPRINPEWPASIRRLLEDCFSTSAQRPSMEVVCTVLRYEINHLSGCDLVDGDLLESARSAASARYIDS